jgi:GNAT superfamily N-acetyltransferase
LCDRLGVSPPSKRPSSFEIREIRAADRRRWDDLWTGYLDFYEHELPDVVTEHLWSGLIDRETQPYALVAAGDAALLGFVHFHFHLSTWRIAGDCYLEDLYVERGEGVGRALIEGVYRAAADRGVTRVSWQTHEANAAARGLYDRVAELSPFVIYRHDGKP